MNGIYCLSLEGKPLRFHQGVFLCRASIGMLERKESKLQIECEDCGTMTTITTDFKHASVDMIEGTIFNAHVVHQSGITEVKFIIVSTNKKNAARSRRYCREDTSKIPYIWN